MTTRGPSSHPHARMPLRTRETTLADPTQRPHERSRLTRRTHQTGTHRRAQRGKCRQISSALTRSSVGRCLQFPQIRRADPWQSPKSFLTQTGYLWTRIEVPRRATPTTPRDYNEMDPGVAWKRSKMSCVSTIMRPIRAEVHRTRPTSARGGADSDSRR